MARLKKNSNGVQPGATENTTGMNTLSLNTIRVKLSFLDEVLGTSPSDENIMRNYIASRSPDADTIEDEVAAIGVEAVVQNGMTIFPRDNGVPFLYDYQIKGFFKDTCGMLSRIKTSESSKVKAYKKIIDGLIFVGPRKIPFDIVGGKIGSCQRPLRASGPQGERVALANSETIPAGSTIEFDIQYFDPSHRAMIIEWLDYGKLRGIGQWRKSGKGRFTYEIVSG